MGAPRLIARTCSSDAAGGTRQMSAVALLSIGSTAHLGPSRCPILTLTGGKSSSEMFIAVPRSQGGIRLAPRMVSRVPPRSEPTDGSTESTRGLPVSVLTVAGTKSLAVTALETPDRVTGGALTRMLRVFGSAYTVHLPSVRFSLPKSPLCGMWRHHVFIT